MKWLRLRTRSGIPLADITGGPVFVDPDNPNPQGDATIHAQAATITQAAFDAAVAEARAEGHAQGRKEAIAEGQAAGKVCAADRDAARAEGAKSALARAQGIVCHAEAKDRRELAEHLAFSSSMSVTEAVEMMTVSGKTVPHGAASAVRGPRTKDAAGGLVLAAMFDRTPIGEPAAPKIDANALYERFSGRAPSQPKPA